MKTIIFLTVIFLGLLFAGTRAILKGLISIFVMVLVLAVRP